MKKTKFFSLIACITILLAITVLGIFAEDEYTTTCGECTVEWTDATKTTVKSVTSGVVYAINSKSSYWAWNYDTFTTATQTVGGKTVPGTGPDGIESIFIKNGSARVDTGMRYDYVYDTVAKIGTLTLYVKDGWTGTNEYYTASWKYPGFPNYYMKELVTEGTDAYTDYGVGSGTYEGGYFERSNVNKLIISDERIKRIGTQFFNYFQKLNEVFITSSLEYLDTNAFSRCYTLKSIKVIGCTDYSEDAQYIVDLRNLKSTDSTTFSEAFSSGNITNTISFYIGEELTKVAEGKNNQFGKSGGTGTINVYTPNSESCPWVDALGNRKVDQWSPTPSYYNVNLFPQSSCVLREVGYQVRTKSYNGLRGLFAYNPNVGKKLIVNGVIQTNPESISILSDENNELIEYGTIAVADPLNIDTELDFRLSLNPSSGNYETSYAKARKVKVWDETNPRKTNLFYVTIVNFGTDPESNNLKTNVFMTGYEIWRDKASGEISIKYTADTAAHIKPTSIYEATVGMYRAGLINHSVEQDNLFWSILDICKENMILDLDDINSKINYTYYAQNSTTKEWEPKQKTQVYNYSVDNGDLRDGDVLISIFKTGTGDNVKYTAIAHPDKNPDGTWKTGITFKGGRFTSENWARSNFLCEAYTGIPIDTIILDSGITKADESALSGFWSGTSSERADSAGTKTTVTYKSDLTTIIYSEDLNTLGGQALVNDNSVTRVVRFNPKHSDPGYVEAGRGTFDISTKDKNGQYISYGTSYVFSKTGATTVLLPPSSTQRTFSAESGMFAYSQGITRIYCPESGYGIPDLGTADLRGTGWIFDAATGTANNSTFRNSSGNAGIIYVINDNGTACARTTATGQAFEWTKTGENITVAGVPLSNFTVNGGTKYVSEAATLNSQIQGIAGDIKEGETGTVTLTTSEDVGYSKCNITLDGKNITISVNPYGISMEKAISFFTKIINDRTTDTITEIDKTFSAIEGTMLENTYYKLTHDKKLNIGYLGGSITYGQGTNATADNCWAGLTTKWFRDNFPAATIKGNNAGIQDTTSDYGLFRLDRDMFVDDSGDEFIPDLFFIEYTSNDGSSGSNPVETITKNTESIIQRVYEKNPYCDIIFVYTKQTSSQSAFESMAVYKADHALAIKYGLLELAPGRLLYNMMIDKFGSIQNTDLADASGAVHPTAKGYQIYSDYMNEYFEHYLITKAPVTADYVATENTDTTGLMMNPHIYGVETVNVQTSGTWNTVTGTIGRGRKPSQSVNIMSSGTNGDTITFEFNGTAFGLMLKRYDAGNNADLSYSVDGGAYTDITLGANYSHMRTKMLEYGLTNSHHTVTIKVKQGSTGSTLGIIAFMVNGTMTTK